MPSFGLLIFNQKTELNLLNIPSIPCFKYGALVHDGSECTGVLKQTSISQETGDFAVQIICSPHPTEKKSLNRQDFNSAYYLPK